MSKIGTHDSVTGEKPTWWSSLLTIFARTQSKNIKEQYYAGARLFDLRTKKVFGVWRGAHGWWFTKKSIEDILSELDSYAEIDKICVHLTFEGKTKNSVEFTKKVNEWKEQFSHIIWGPICTKYGTQTKGLKVKYDRIMPGDKDSWGGIQSFLPLDGRWQTYFPIPIFWKLFYFKNIKEMDCWQWVDFL